MKKHKNKLIIILFLLVIYGGFFVNLFRPLTAFSKNENRVLSQFPEWTVKSLFNGTFMKQSETAFTDQFAGRDGWLALKAVNEKILGKIENHGIYWLNEGRMIPRFLEYNEKTTVQNTRSILNFAAQNNMMTRVMLVPSAAAILKEELPEAAFDLNQKQLLESLEDQFADSDIDFINLFEKLNAHRDEPIYFDTDHHWTSQGAYYAAQSFLETEGKQLLPLDQYTNKIISKSFKGTSYSKSQQFWLSGEELSYFDRVDFPNVTVTYDLNDIQKTVYSEKRLSEKDKYAYFLDGNHALTEIVNEDKEEGNLLIVKDSYAHILVPLLVPYYHKITMIDLRYFNSRISDYLLENPADSLLVLYSLGQFTTDTNLKLLR